MELDEVIKKRISIRKYQKDKQVSLDKIALLLNAAKTAPNSGNLQDFRFLVVHEKDLKEKIAEASLKQYWMNSAPVFIVICSDIQRLETYYKDQAEKYSLQNSSAAAMLIILKAVDLNLSTCWVDVFDPHAVSRILRLPNNVKPQIILTLGYEQERSVKKFSKIPLSRITFFNKYGTRIANLKQFNKSYFEKIKKAFSKK